MTFQHFIIHPFTVAAVVGAVVFIGLDLSLSANVYEAWENAVNSGNAMNWGGQ